MSDEERLDADIDSEEGDNVAIQEVDGPSDS